MHRFITMLFSKSFGYALRGILYLAAVQEEGRKVQIDEVAVQLGVPRHYLAKIFKRLVKAGLLLSVRGPYGGFILHPDTLKQPVLSIIMITDGLSTFRNCVLRLQECDNQNPCPLHQKVEDIKLSLRTNLQDTAIGDLVMKKPQRH